MTSQPSERAAVVACVSPFNGNNAATSSAAVDMSKFRQALFVLAAGELDSTVDCKLQESANGSTSWTDISGKSITQLTTSNKQVVINLQSQELSAGKRYVKAVATVGNGTTNMICLLALGMVPRFAPATDDDLASVVEIVT